MQGKKGICIGLKSNLDLLLGCVYMTCVDERHPDWFSGGSDNQGDQKLWIQGGAYTWGCLPATQFTAQP